MLTPWTQIPEAAALLASIGANPPKCERFTKEYVITREEWHEYDRADPRVARLAEIEDNFFTEVIIPASGNLSAHSRDEILAAYPTLEMAIDAAIAAHADKTITLARVA